MSKESEALERIKREAGIPYFSSLYDIDMWKEDFETVEKSLKALEIIKEKKVNVNLLLELDCKNLEDYNCYAYNALTQEEFNLLKEILK